MSSRLFHHHKTECLARYTPEKWSPRDEEFKSNVKFDYLDGQNFSDKSFLGFYIQCFSESKRPRNSIFRKRKIKISELRFDFFHGTVTHLQPRFQLVLRTVSPEIFLQDHSLPRDHCAQDLLTFQEYLKASLALAITLNSASSKFRNDIIEVLIVTYHLKE